MSRLLNHWLPLDPKDERHATFRLPSDLTEAEALRLAGFVAALAIPEEEDR